MTPIIDEAYEAFVSVVYQRIKDESQDYVEVKTKIGEEIKKVGWHRPELATVLKKDLLDMAEKEIDSILETLPINTIKCQKVNLNSEEEIVNTIDLYADNAIYRRVLQISLPIRDWCKLQKQPFYQKLMRYLDNLQIQKSSELQTTE